jgi:hypothetical protein
MFGCQPADEVDVFISNSAAPVSAFRHSVAGVAASKLERKGVLGFGDVRFARLTSNSTAKDTSFLTM